MLIINLALHNAALNEAHILSSLLSNSVSTSLDLTNVGVDTQTVMTALTLGLAFPEVRTYQTLINIVRHAKPSQGRYPPY